MNGKEECCCSRTYWILKQCILFSFNPLVWSFKKKSASHGRGLWTNMSLNGLSSWSCWVKRGIITSNAAIDLRTASFLLPNEKENQKDFRFTKQWQLYPLIYSCALGLCSSSSLDILKNIMLSSIQMIFPTDRPSKKWEVPWMCWNTGAQRHKYHAYQRTVHSGMILRSWLSDVCQDISNIKDELLSLKSLRSIAFRNFFHTETSINFESTVWWIYTYRCP